jgi:hypothetical protein
LRQPAHRRPPHLRRPRHPQQHAHNAGSLFNRQCRRSGGINSGKEKLQTERSGRRAGTGIVGGARSVFVENYEFRITNYELRITNYGMINDE